LPIKLATASPNLKEKGKKKKNEKFNKQI